MSFDPKKHYNSAPPGEPYRMVPESELRELRATKAAWDGLTAELTPGEHVGGIWVKLGLADLEIRLEGARAAEAEREAKPVHYAVTIDDAKKNVPEPSWLSEDHSGLTRARTEDGREDRVPYRVVRRTAP